MNSTWSVKDSTPQIVNINLKYNSWDGTFEHLRALTYWHTVTFFYSVQSNLVAFNIGHMAFVVDILPCSSGFHHLWPNSCVNLSVSLSKVLFEVDPRSWSFLTGSASLWCLMVNCIMTCWCLPSSHLLMWWSYKPLFPWMKSTVVQFWTEYCWSSSFSLRPYNLRFLFCLQLLYFFFQLLIFFNDIWHFFFHMYFVDVFSVCTH